MRVDPDESALRRYLLGLLPEAEAEALEEAYLARPEVLERVRGVEDDLLDDYASGRLDAAEKRAFESRFLTSPPLRERVVAARALRLAMVDRQVPERRLIRARWRRWRGPLAIAAGLLLALVAFWKWPTRPPQVAPGSAPPTTAARSEPTPSPGARPLVLTLSPVLLRARARPPELRVPSGTDTVVFELEGDPVILPQSVSVLEASIETVEGEPVWRGEARRVVDGGRPSLLASARVPAERLSAGDYLLKLSARDAADETLYSYFFRVSLHR